MFNKEFEKIMEKQFSTCRNVLTFKGASYAPHAVELKEEPSGQLAYDFAFVDRLQAFKKAGALQGTNAKAALFGMLAKHLVSINDMCRSGDSYFIATWNEKITDAINYLILLRALVEEEGARDE